MTDRFFDIAAFAAGTVLVGVSLIFFGTLTALTLKGFGVFPAIY